MKFSFCMSNGRTTSLSIYNNHVQSICFGSLRLHFLSQRLRGKKETPEVVTWFLSPSFTQTCPIRQSVLWDSDFFGSRVECWPLTPIRIFGVSGIDADRRASTRLDCWTNVCYPIERVCLRMKSQNRKEEKRDKVRKRERYLKTVIKTLDLAVSPL